MQTVVDAEHALIVTHEVTAEATDDTSLQSMAEVARDALEQPTHNVVADAGYYNGAQAEALDAQGIVPHVPANRAVINQGDASLFDRRHFVYDEGTDTVRCPGGQDTAAQAGARHAGGDAVAPMRRRVPLRQLEVPNLREAAVPAARPMGRRHRDEPRDAGVEPEADDDDPRGRCSARAPGLRLRSAASGPSGPRNENAPQSGASLLPWPHRAF